MTHITISKNVHFPPFIILETYFISFQINFIEVHKDRGSTVVKVLCYESEGR